MCVGCDELSARKGHRYVSVFCDLIGKRVLFAAPGKDKGVWEAFVGALGEHNGHPRAITEVSIDMSPAYIAGVKENLGDQAVIVFDKFHVVAHANAAVDETRRAEQRHLGKAQREQLKGARWALLKNPANHTPKQAERYAQELAKSEPKGVLYANQWDNLSNRTGHVRSTGPEIWEQTGGRVDGFTCAIGTGGTLSGVGVFLKERNKDIRVVAADPVGAAMYSYIRCGVLESAG